MNAARAWEILKDNGYKKTDKRELILGMFAATDKYLTARDLLSVLKKDFLWLKPVICLVKENKIMESLTIKVKQCLNIQAILAFIDGMHF